MSSWLLLLLYTVVDAGDEPVDNGRQLAVVADGKDVDVGRIAGDADPFGQRLPVLVDSDDEKRDAGGAGLDRLSHGVRLVERPAFDHDHCNSLRRRPSAGARGEHLRADRADRRCQIRRPASAHSAQCRRQYITWIQVVFRFGAHNTVVMINVHFNVFRCYFEVFGS